MDREKDAIDVSRLLTRVKPDFTAVLEFNRCRILPSDQKIHFFQR